MLTEIQKFEKNAIAVELTDSFTEADAQLIKQLFEDKLKKGYPHINILIKVKDLSIMMNMNLKAFFEGEWWGVKHFGKIGRCAVVSHSSLLETVVTVENKVLQLFNSALEEKYFDESQLADAIKFIDPQ